MRGGELWGAMGMKVPKPTCTPPAMVSTPSAVSSSSDDSIAFTSHQATDDLWDCNAASTARWVGPGDSAGLWTTATRTVSWPDWESQ